MSGKWNFEEIPTLEIEGEPLDRCYTAGKIHYSFPTVRFGHDTRSNAVTAIFNAAAAAAFPEDLYGFDLYVNSRAVVFVPSPGGNRINKDRKKMSANALRNKGLEGNAYRLYRCKQGFALLRDNPLEESGGKHDA